MRDLLTDRQPCSETEKQELLAYLRKNSHVKLPAQMIERGHGLEKATVKGAERIGQLQTCFKNLGDAYAKTLYGREFFLVKEALAVFTDPGPNPHPDVVQDVRKVRAYADLFARPDSNPTVTIVEIQGVTVIADGDKTALAAYLHATERGLPDFVLPVYYVGPSLQ